MKDYKRVRGQRAALPPRLIFYPLRQGVQTGRAPGPKMVGPMVSFIRLSLQRFLTHPWQTGLTVLGIAIGVANIIALLGFSYSAREQTAKLFREIGAEVFFVTPYFETEGGPLGGNPASALGMLSPKDIEVVRGVEGVESAGGILIAPVWVRAGKRQIFTALVGAPHDYQQFRRVETSQGRFFSREEEEGRAEVAVLGATVAGKLFPSGGAVGREVVLMGRSLRVVGVLEPTGEIIFEDIDNRVYLPLPLAMELTGLGGVHTILARTKPGEDLAGVMERVRKVLHTAHQLGPEDPPDVSVFDIKTITRLRDKTFGIFAIIVGAVGTIALIVAGINILNVMLISVLERIREIGIRKACGARRRDILFQFLLDAVLQSLVGSLLGAGLGVWATFYLTRRVGWETYFPFWLVIGALAFGVMVGVLFGIAPALRAAFTDPIEALRYE